MEVFAIQQSDLLGQVLYDAATGEHIKEWYLPSVYDVGRGRCIDVDSTVRGYEVYSMLPNLYDCKGNVTHNQDTILLRIPEGYEPVAGEEYSVFTGSGKQSGSYVLKTDCEDFRVTWDDSRLLSEGIIKVSEVVSTGIKAIGASSGSVQVYSVSGELLRKDVPEEEALQGLPAGVYVVNGKKIRKQ